MRFRAPHWETFAAGAEALEDILPSTMIEKANPLRPAGFDQVVRGLVRAIARETRGADRQAIGAAARRLDKNWTQLADGARAKIIRAAAESILAVPRVVVDPVKKTLRKSVAEIIADTKEATKRQERLRIAATFTEADERVVDFAARSQGNYITDAYGDRAVAFEQRARDIVAKGIEAGFDRHEIGQRLKAALIDPALRTADSYWESVASIHASRARSWGQLASFSEAGIEAFEWVSVLDEVTSLQCRLMHGRRFSVARAHARYEEVEQSDDPYAVASLQPWLRVGKTKDGGQVIFADRGEGRRSMLAQVERSGYGKVDDAGDFSRVAAAGRFESLGVTSPPAHPRCRSTIVPA